MDDPSFLPQTLAGWAQVSLPAILIISAFVALYQLRKNISQSRAAVLLELEQMWDRVEESRKIMQGLKEEVRKDVFGRFSNKNDAEQEKQIRSTYAAKLQDMKDNKGDDFTKLCAYFGFYETVGLMVREGYMPFNDAYKLYKGPLVEVERACCEFIPIWEGEAHTPEGLFENMLLICRKASKRHRREAFRNSLKFWKRKS